MQRWVEQSYIKGRHLNFCLRTELSSSQRFLLAFVLQIFTFPQIKHASRQSLCILEDFPSFTSQLNPRPPISEGGKRHLLQTRASFQRTFRGKSVSPLQRGHNSKHVPRLG